MKDLGVLGKAGMIKAIEQREALNREIRQLNLRDKEQRERRSHLMNERVELEAEYPGLKENPLEQVFNNYEWNIEVNGIRYNFYSLQDESVSHEFDERFKTRYLEGKARQVLLEAGDCQIDCVSRI